MSFTTNERSIKNSKVFKKFSEEFDSNIQFLENFSFLIFSNRRIIFFHSNGKSHIINTILLDNSIQTLKSIKLCCEIGSFADANTLIRKLRDDLILYVYILDVTNKNNPFTQESLKELKTNSLEEFSKSFLDLKYKTKLTEDEKVVEAWLTNTVLNLPRNIKLKLSFENYMKFLKKNETIIKILNEYKLEKYWEDLRNKLNNYVHNNGIQFTSHNLIKEHSEYLDIYLKNINTRTSYIITLFLVLIIMTEGTLISSTDMIDYLDCDMKPPEDCQYEVAPFIQDFINQKVVSIHPELKAYLQDNNKYRMKIE